MNAIVKRVCFVALGCLGLSGGVIAGETSCNSDCQRDPDRRQAAMSIPEPRTLGLLGLGLLGLGLGARSRRNR